MPRMTAPLLRMSGRGDSPSAVMKLLMMPVSSNSCYTMNITTESGRVFTTSFLTGDVYEDE